MDWLPQAKQHWLPRPDHVAAYRVRVWFQSPIAYDPYYPLTLEGALQHEVILRTTGRLPDDVFADYRGPLVDIPIPIVDVDRAGRKVAACSVAQLAPGAHESVRRKRKRGRYELYAMPGGRGLLKTSEGSMKSLDVPIQTRVSPYVDFFCVGDGQRLKSLLPTLYRLGRCRGGGLGAVVGCELDLATEDRSLTYRGAPQRILPVASGEDAAREFTAGSYEVRECGTRAPYWHRGSWTLAAVPL